MAEELAESLRASASAPSAFSGVYRNKVDELLGFFFRRTFDAEVARDLMAETFAQAFEHRRRFRGRTDAEAAAWLYRIASGQLGRYVRRGAIHRRAVERLGIEVPALSEDDHHRILELAGLADLRRSVADAFSQLPPEQQEALQLRVLDEQDYPAVAAALGVSEQTARARVSRALRRIAATTDTPTPAEALP